MIVFVFVFVFVFVLLVLVAFCFSSQCYSFSIPTSFLGTLFQQSNFFPSQRHEDAGLKFIEVFVNTPLAECEKRDPKGLYKKARAGEIPQFTGISAPYEEPENPEILLLPAEKNVDECCEQVLEYLVAQGLVTKN